MKLMYKIKFEIFHVKLTLKNWNACFQLSGAQKTLSLNKISNQKTLSLFPIT